MRAPSILEVMEDADTFGPHFKGETWAAWKAFLAALFGLEMTPELAEIAERHTGRNDLPAEPFTEATLICGRRAGKSRVLAFVATYLATARDYSPHLAPGEVATVGIAASTQKQARSIYRYIAGAFDTVPELAELVLSKTADTLELSNRVVIEISVASFRATRGYSYAAFLADEVAFWRDDNSANPDEEILKAIRPGLSSIPGSILLVASSPYAKRGALYKAFQRHYGKPGARVLVWKAATREMNPGIDPRIIEEAFEDDPEGASSEYGGEFRSDISAFLPRDVVEAAVEPGRHELPPLPGTEYVAFVDPAGGTGGDSMTLAIAHAEGERVVLDCIREIKSPFSPDTATAEFAETLKAYGLSRVTGDRYGGAWPLTRFDKHGIAYEFSERVKSDIYREFLPLMNAKRAELLDSQRLVNQLISLERRVARGGRDSIDHPPGQHDDVANAVAGALVLAGARDGSDAATWCAAFGIAYQPAQTP